MTDQPPNPGAARRHRLVAAAAFVGVVAVGSVATAEPSPPDPPASPTPPTVTIVPSPAPAPTMTIVPSPAPAPTMTIVPSPAPAPSAPATSASVAPPEAPVALSNDDTLGPSQPNTTLLVTGGVAAGVGYVVAIFSASLGAAHAGSFNSQYGGSCGGVGSPALSFIPIVGPFLTMATYPNHQVASYPPTAIAMQMPYVIDCLGGRTAVQALAIGEEALQLAGAGLIGLGLALRSPSQSQRGSIVLSPGTAATPAGATLRIAF